MKYVLFEPVVTMLPLTTKLPITVKFPPTVESVFAKKLFNVASPLVPIVVNSTVLAVTFQIGVFCIPPAAFSRPPALILPPTPRPPPNTIAPVLVLVEFVELLNPAILLP